MKFDAELERIKKGFSKKQKKLFDRIKPLVGRKVSIGLISLQGVERTTQAEIEVIANLICQFEPVSILSFQSTPRRITFSGEVGKGHSVQIIPQHKVANTNPKAQDWAIDLVLELHRVIGHDFVKIAAIGIEYDGHPSYYVESNIKNTYQCDIGIVSNDGVLSIRIPPESWKEDPNYIKKSLTKYFEHQIKIIDEVQVSTLNAYQFIKPATEEPDSHKLTICPICNGRCQLAGDDCPACKGMGSVKQLVAEQLDLTEYDNFTCPSCRGIQLDCSSCNGSGTISRERALES